MKILIGTPIHEIKDYSLERWLENVADLTKETPADLFMVDNSPNTNYVEKVAGYCKKYGVKNYKITHFDFDQGMSDDEIERRVEVAQEIIRREILSNNYDVWFSWECDQIIPNDALDKLAKLMSVQDIMMVTHNSWVREFPDIFNPDMGVALITRQCLEKYRSLFKRHHDWQGDEGWFKKRVLRDGGNYIDVYGLINPIYHLDK